MGGESVVTSMWFYLNLHQSVASPGCPCFLNLMGNISLWCNLTFNWAVGKKKTVAYYRDEWMKWKVGCSHISLVIRINLWTPFYLPQMSFPSLYGWGIKNYSFPINWITMMDVSPSEEVSIAAETFWGWTMLLKVVCLFKPASDAGHSSLFGLVKSRKEFWIKLEFAVTEKTVFRVGKLHFSGSVILLCHSSCQEEFCIIESW